MIDDPQDETAARITFIAGTPRSGATIHPPVFSVLRDIEDQVLVIRSCWEVMTVDERHDAVAELHERCQAANTALLDAVRLSDFEQAHS